MIHITMPASAIALNGFFHGREINVTHNTARHRPIHWLPSVSTSGAAAAKTKWQMMPIQPSLFQIEMCAVT